MLFINDIISFPHCGHAMQMQVPVGVGTRGAVRGRPMRESIGTISRGDNISDFDRESSWRSMESLGTSNVRNVHSLSSKHSQAGSHDSDAWHSESEANWTMVEVYSNQPKDITQSQVLSEIDEPKQSQLAYTPSWSKSVATEHSLSPNPQFLNSGEKNYHFLPTHFEKDLSSNGNSEGKSSPGGACYNFEPRRSLEVFGDCSWNSLSLAMNSNFVQSGLLLATYILVPSSCSDFTVLSAAGVTPQNVLGLSMSMLVSVY